MKKKSVEPKKLLDMQCPKCGRVTHHYLNELTGEYKCVVCQSVNKTIKVKPKKEVVFEMDAELDAALNPVVEMLENAPESANIMDTDAPVEENEPVND